MGNLLTKLWKWCCSACGRAPPRIDDETTDQGLLLPTEQLSNDTLARVQIESHKSQSQVWASSIHDTSPPSQPYPPPSPPPPSPLPPQEEHIPKRRALLVGICYGQCATDESLPELKGSHKDVEQMRRLLIDHFGYKDEWISVMMDAPSVDDKMQPTKENMTRELSKFVEGCIPGDRFVFAFSGHSDQQKQKLEENVIPEEDEMDEVIITSDGKRIRDNKLYEWLVKPLPSGAGLFALLDSCHSGTMLDLPHHNCNGIYVPWISKGIRRSDTRRLNIVRGNARLNSRLSSISPKSTRSSIHELIAEADEVREAHMVISKHTKLTLNTRLQTTLASMDGSTRLDISPRSTFSLHQRSILGGIYMMSPVCESPETGLFCTGWCHYDENWRSDHADVVSLSACTDMQRAWEDRKGRSLVPLFCEYMNRQKRHGHQPTYFQVIEHLSHKLYNNSRKVHAWSLKERREARSKGTEAPDGELVNFQTPELSSLTRLNLADEFRV